jgi:hypothetical protein
MAKHVILESYTFTPSTKTVVITGKNIRREQLLLITNVTSNVVIYNFSDASVGAASYTNAADSITGQETTTIVLSYNTAAMSASDKLSILVEETYTEIIPSETMRDPVDKLRVSTPQALIDTDFEYGTQPTKWEGLSLLSNRPGTFYDVTTPISNTTITNITAAGRAITVTLNNTSMVSVGQPIFIIGSLDTGNVDGWWVVDSIVANTSFTFTSTNIAATSLFDVQKTYVYPASFFTGAGIGVSSITVLNNTATVTTSLPHALNVGDGIYIIGTTGVTGLNGSWTVASTPYNNVFTYVASQTLTGTPTLANGPNQTLYPRSLGYIQHRAFDGGVQFSNVTPYHGYQLVRQTRRQFRYQSGKGIQFSTGSILKPTVNPDRITSSGQVVTVTTKYPHGLLPGGVIKVSGANETAYNGTFTVVSSPSPTSFTYTAATSPSASPATGFPITISPFSWYGGKNRVGMFDSQNGFFFEYDGQTLYAVKRSSTTQISGNSQTSPLGYIVTGTNTRYSQELKPGDNIVIRGMTYLVTGIMSDTTMAINPEYRGMNATTATVISKTIDQRYPQSSWNIDKMDGTGQSLMNLDLNKMQMFYADFTWYGAGAIRFGFKDNRGQVIYAHRIPNNNVNTEAYMRSGNLVARYETNSIPPTTYLTATLAQAATTGAAIYVADASLFPSTGTVVVTQTGTSFASVEYINYSAKTTSTLTISSRNTFGGTGTAAQFTLVGTSSTFPGGTAPTMVTLFSPQQASSISHWGSSVIMDGRYDDDKSLVFNVGQNTPFTNLTQNVRVPLLSIRIAPTVDNGSIGLLGYREIMNRMQLTLRQMDAYTTGTAFRIELVLNGRPTQGVWQNVGGSSLAQVAYHSGAGTILGGESVFGFFTNIAAATSQDLSQVRDIGTSILSGGTSTNVSTTVNNVYPDGPDVLTLCATAVQSSSNQIFARISWTEAQA